MACAVPERDQTEGRQAHRPVFIIALCVEDAMAWIMSEHFPVATFYECKKRKKLQQSLRFILFFSLRIMNLLQNHTSKEVTLKDKTAGKYSVFQNTALSFQIIDRLLNFRLNYNI